LKAWAKSRALALRGNEANRGSQSVIPSGASGSRSESDAESRDPAFVASAGDASCLASPWASSHPGLCGGPLLHAEQPGHRNIARINLPPSYRKQPNNRARRRIFSQSEQASLNFLSARANLLLGCNDSPYSSLFFAPAQAVIPTETVISLNPISSRKSSLTFASSRSFSNSM
jgi:hypothetical protein